MGRKSDAKSRLMQVAQHAFWTRSCLGVSVDTLCREAGVNKGSFYHFFPSKQAIVIATLDALWKQVRQELLEASFDPRLPPIERVRQLFLRAYGMQKAAFDETGQVPGCPFLSLGCELSTQDEGVRLHVAEILRRYILYIELALRDALELGHISGDPAESAKAVYSTYAGLLIQARIMNRPDIIIEGVASAIVPLRSGATPQPVPA